MFKKLASLLFEEEEVVEDSKEEKVDLRRSTKQTEQTRKQTESVRGESDPNEKSKRSSFENIVVDSAETKSDELDKPFVDDEKMAPVRPSEPAFIDRKPLVTKGVYEFKPVISPMFGIKESDKEHIRPTFVQTAEVKNDSHLQTVISPYYGAIHKDLKTGPQTNRPQVIEPTLFKAKVAEYVEEAKPIIINNISLEELIQPTAIVPNTKEEPNLSNPEEKPEDVTQFSLFEED